MFESPSSDLARTTNRDILAKLSGETFWRIRWIFEGKQYHLNINEIRGEVSNYSTGRMPRRDKGHEAVPNTPFTREQILHKAQEVARAAVDANVEWREGDTVLMRGSDQNEYYWSSQVYRVIDGYTCGRDFVVCKFEQTDGTLMSYYCHTSGVRLPPSGPLLPEAQARRIAQVLYAPYLKGLKVRWSLTDDMATYMPLTRLRDICRLVYVYDFIVVQTPEEEERNPSRPYRVEVDAETGEIWRAGSPYGGADSKIPNKIVVRPSSVRQVEVAAQLLRDKPLMPLGRAIASGKALPRAPSKPMRGGVAFEVTLPVGSLSSLMAPPPTQAIPFRWRASERRLLWRMSDENGKEKWYAVERARPEADRLEAWRKEHRP